jgi:hypothetical protein
VSQRLDVPAALDPTISPLDRLVLVEAVTHAQETKLFLLQQLPVLGESKRPPSLLRLHDKPWSQRPFEYSSAINPGIAELVMDILVALTRRRHGHGNRTCHDDNDGGDATPVHLWDPTCGSGTFLAVAMHRGMQVSGWDINPHCIAGTHENLVHVFGETKVQSDCQLKVRDSSLGRTADETLPQKQPGPRIDCVACNLPWGLNSAADRDQNGRILTTLRQEIRGAGVPCALVSKGDGTPLAAEVLRAQGFRLVDQAHVPQQNFTLPRGNKKGGRSKSTGQPKGRSDCVVTLVETV